MRSLFALVLTIFVSVNASAEINTYTVALCAQGSTANESIDNLEATLAKINSRIGLKVIWTEPSAEGSYNRVGTSGVREGKLTTIEVTSYSKSSFRVSAAVEGGVYNSCVNVTGKNID